MSENISTSAILCTGFANILFYRTCMSFILCNHVYICRRHFVMRCIDAGCRCASSDLRRDAFWALAPRRISYQPDTQRGIPSSCHISFLSADASLMEPLQSHTMASCGGGAIDTYEIMRSYDRSLWLSKTSHATIAEVDRHLAILVRSLMVVQAAAAAAERRARDDAGCACGLKGSTAFTEAEVIELESQPGSAVASQQDSKQEPSVPSHSRSEPLNPSRPCPSDSTGSLESREQGTAKLLNQMHGDAERQADGSLQGRVSLQSQEELIDLVSDSEGEVEVVE